MFPRKKYHTEVGGKCITATPRKRLRKILGTKDLTKPEDVLTVPAGTCIGFKTNTCSALPEIEEKGKAGFNAKMYKHEYREGSNFDGDLTEAVRDMAHRWYIPVTDFQLAEANI